MTQEQLALDALRMWSAWRRSRGPLYNPGPADYSRPFGTARPPIDETWYVAVEEVLMAAGAPGGRLPTHPLRQILEWIWEDELNPRPAESFPWMRVFPGTPETHQRWLLGMPRQMRAKGEYEALLRSLTIKAQEVQARLDAERELLEVELH